MNALKKRLTFARVGASLTVLLCLLAVLQAVPASAGTFTVPKRIARNCSRDVTRALNRYFKSVPDGRAGSFTTIRFPAHACYRVNGTLRIQGRDWLTFAGSSSAPAVFRATRRGHLDFQGLSQRRHWWIVNSDHIRIRNISVVSTNTRPDPEIHGGGFAVYNSRYEFEHGFDISGGSRRLDHRFQRQGRLGRLCCPQLRDRPTVRRCWHSRRPTGASQMLMERPTGDQHRRCGGHPDRSREDHEQPQGRHRSGAEHLAQRRPRCRDPELVHEHPPARIRIGRPQRGLRHLHPRQHDQQQRHPDRVRERLG